MKIFVILITILNIESSIKTHNTSLEENLPFFLNRLSAYFAKTSVVLPFVIKLKEQFQEIKVFLQKFLVEESDSRTIVDELEKKLKHSRALFEEYVIKDNIEDNDMIIMILKN